jgi:hypothetical protein
MRCWQRNKTGVVGRRHCPAPTLVYLHQSPWEHVLVLIVGSILTPGRRTVAAALRVMGLDQPPDFSNYRHRVLNRNRLSLMGRGAPHRWHRRRRQQ